MPPGSGAKQGSCAGPLEQRAALVYCDGERLTTTQPLRSLMKPGICNHMHVNCTDLTAMIDFWTKGFGATFVEFRNFGPSEGAVLDLGNPIKLYLKQLPCARQEASAARGGMDHVGMEVESMDEALKHLLALPQVQLTREPFDSRGNLCAFIAGPDGVSIELMQMNS